MLNSNNKVVRRIEVFKEPNESDEVALKRFMKMYNISDEEIKSGAVVLKVLDQDKLFSPYRNYKKNR